MYDRPENWGSLGQWELFGIGYSVVESIPWLGFSLYYPDPESAEADASKLVGRMIGYRSAITPVMYPKMHEEVLRDVQRYPINDAGISLAPTVARLRVGSILTVWCQMREGDRVTWWEMLQTRDLAFLLP